MDLSDLFDVNFYVILILNLNGRVVFIVMLLLMFRDRVKGNNFWVNPNKGNFMTREKVTYRLWICS